MPEARALLQAICEQRDDDLPRLAYADWLEETGGPAERCRAEFIRAQIELAKMGEDDPRRADLERREAALLGAHGFTWAAEVHPSAHNLEFRRGFVERLRLNLDDFPGVARRLFLVDLNPVSGHLPYSP